MTLPRVIMIAVLLFCGNLNGCSRLNGAGTNTGAERSKSLNELAISVRGQPPTLNPLLASGPGGLEPDFLFSFLTRVDSDGSTGPDLVTHVPTIENGGIAKSGLALTYFLRRGVRWHDGIELTADDVAFTFAALKDPRNNVALPAPLDDVLSLRAIDRYTVGVRLRRPNSQMTSTLFSSAWALPIVPAHAFPAGAGSLNHAAFNGSPIGSGPYRLVNWVRGDHVTLEANPYYFKGVPSIKTLVVYFNDWETAFNEYRSGQLDALLNVPVNYYTTAARLPDQSTFKTATAGYHFIAFNMKSRLMADPRIRRAITLGIDRVFLANGATRGAVDSRSAAKGIFNAFYDPAVKPPRYDPAEARAILDAAGWHVGALGLRAKDGAKLTVRLISNTEPLSQTVDIVAQEQLRAIGIDVAIKTFDSGTLFDAETGAIARGDFDLFYTSFWALPAYYPAWFFTCDANRVSGNYGAYCDPAMDALYRDSLRRYDVAGLQSDFTRMQRRMYIDLPLIPLWQFTRVDVCRTTFSGCDTKQSWPVASIERWQSANQGLPIRASGTRHDGVKAR